MTRFIFSPSRRAWLVGALIYVAGPLTFAQAEDTASSLQERYAAIRLQHLEEEDQEAPLTVLLEEAEKYREANLNSAAAWIACARIRLAYASTQGLGGLRILKTVRDEFEKAIALDERAQDGFAPIFLGFLYSVYPSWPISIGDKARGTELADAAIAINSTNMANNYYYALYLATQNENNRAREYLQKARQAQESSPEMPLIQKFLEREINTALQSIGND